MATAYTDQVQKVYIAYYGRAADPVGLAYWAAKVETDGLAGIMASFGASAEATTLYGSLTNTAKVNALFQQSFGRDADFAGLMYYAGQLTAGTMTAATIAQNIFDGASGNDATILANKLVVAKAYTAAVDTAAEVVAYSGTVAAASARALLTTVDAATVTASFDVATSVASIVSVSNATPAVAGTTYKLTATTDSLTGSAGADTFTGVLQANSATGTTAAPGDAISGGAGTDTLSISVAGDVGSADYTLAALSLTDVEKVHLSNFDTDGTFNNIVDTSLMTGLTHVGLSASAAEGDTTFSNVKNFVEADMMNGSGDLTVTYGTTVVAGTTDSQTLNVSNITAGTFTAAGVETVNVKTGLVASTLTDITAASATKLTVSGDTGLTITNAQSAATIDASAMAGALTLKLGAAAQTYTGGAGADVIDIQGNLTFADTLTGGASADTLKMTAAGTIDATASSGELSGVSGFETIQVNSTADAATVDMTGVTGVTTLEAAANTKTATITGDNGAQSSTATITFSLNGTSYTTAATDLSGNAGADVTAAEASITTKINTISGFSAVDGTGVAITATTGEAVEIAFTDQTGATIAESAYKDVSFIDLEAGTDVGIYSGDSVTVNLADASGTADSMTVNLLTLAADKGFNKTIGTLVVNDVETLNLAANGMTDEKETIITTLTATSSLTTLNITGDSDIDLSGTVTAGKLATVNASTFTGDLEIDAIAGSPALAQTITTGAGNDTIIFGANLNNADTVDMGANEASTAGVAGSDLLTATVTGLTATTGALSIANAEVIDLTNNGTAVIDGTAITGTSTINLFASTDTTTFSNLGTSASIGLGKTAAADQVIGTVTVGLADETGTSDSISIGINEATSATLKATAIETVNFTLSTTDTDIAESTLTVSALNATNLTVTGAAADTGHTLSLGTLDTDTTSLDASGYKGVLTVTAGAATGSTISVGGDRLHSITGSSAADTFTVGATTAADMTIDGNGGTDVLNITLGDGAQDLDSITDIDTVNVTVSGSAGVTTAAAGALDGINEAGNVNFSGGNSLSTVTLGGTALLLGSTGKAATVTTIIDLSAYSGVLSDATFAVDEMDDSEIGETVQVIGTVGADTVSASYDADADATVAINTQGIETLDIALADSSVELVIDMAKVTDLTTVKFTDASSESVELLNLATGVTVDVTSTDATATRTEVKLASSTGSSDSQTFVVAAATADDNVNLVTADIETLSISSDTAAQVDLSLAGVSMTAAAGVVTVNLTGTNDIELIATSNNINVIDASGMGTGGAIVQSARSLGSASTYTGSAGNDTFIMLNAGDVLDGGAGTGDTLTITETGILGGIAIDLSSTTDQVTSYDSVANPAIQKNFENVDVSGFTNFGVSITGSAGANTLTGSAQVDSIGGGAGADTIVITGGNDVITGGAGIDTFDITEALLIAHSATTATIDGGAGVDILQLEAASINIEDADFARITTMETLNLVSGTNNVDVGSNAVAAGIVTITDGTGADTIAFEGGDYTVTLGADSAVDTLDLSAITGLKTVTGFVSTSDTFEIIGALKTALMSDTAEVAGDVSANTSQGATYAVQTAATGIVVLAENGTLTVADLTASTLTAVATSINGAFNIADGGDSNANTEVFAVESDTAGTFGVYAWLQSSGTDGTLAASELTILGVVTADDLAAADLDIG